MAYRQAQHSFVDLCSTFTAADWAAAVPCNPAWTVRDVLSHVAGVTNDIVEGNVEGAATDPWTAVQVERWRDVTVEEIIARWNEQIDAVADAIAAFGERRPPLDCHSHEHDIRHALGRPGDQNSELITWISELFEQNPVGRPVEIDLRRGTTMTIAGEGEPISLTGVSRFDVVRSRLGRRSRRQVEQWSWSTPLTVAEFDEWFVFGPSEVDIHE